MSTSVQFCHCGTSGHSVGGMMVASVMVLMEVTSIHSSGNTITTAPRISAVWIVTDARGER